MNNELYLSIHSFLRENYPTEYKKVAPVTVSRSGYIEQGIVKHMLINLCYKATSEDASFRITQKQLHKILQPLSLDDEQIAELRAQLSAARYKKASAKMIQEDTTHVHPSESFNKVFSMFIERSDHVPSMPCFFLEKAFVQVWLAVECRPNEIATSKDALRLCIENFDELSKRGKNNLSIQYSMFKIKHQKIFKSIKKAIADGEIDVGDFVIQKLPHNDIGALLNPDLKLKFHDRQEQLDAFFDRVPDLWKKYNIPINPPKNIEDFFFAVLEFSMGAQTLKLVTPSSITIFGRVKKYLEKYPEIWHEFCQAAGVDIEIRHGRKFSHKIKKLSVEEILEYGNSDEAADDITTANIAKKSIDAQSVKSAPLKVSKDTSKLKSASKSPASEHHEHHDQWSFNNKSVQKSSASKRTTAHNDESKQLHVAELESKSDSLLASKRKVDSHEVDVRIPKKLKLAHEQEAQQKHLQNTQKAPKEKAPWEKELEKYCGPTTQFEEGFVIPKKKNALSDTQINLDKKAASSKSVAQEHKENYDQWNFNNKSIQKSSTSKRATAHEDESAQSYVAELVSKFDNASVNKHKVNSHEVDVRIPKKLELAHAQEVQQKHSQNTQKAPKKKAPWEKELEKYCGPTTQFEESFVIPKKKKALPDTQIKVDKEAVSDHTHHTEIHKEVVSDQTHHTQVDQHLTQLGEVEHGDFFEFS